MATNLHVPQRLEGESFDAYRRRRVASQRVARMVLAGHALARPDHIGSSRRHAVKALGGIRQYKRAQYLRRYPDYAARHPAMAANRRS